MTDRGQRAGSNRRAVPRVIAASGGLAVAATLLSGSVSEAAGTGPTITVTTLGDTSTPAASHVHNHQAPTLADAITYLDHTSTGGRIFFASSLSGTLNETHQPPPITEPIYLDGPKVTIHDEVANSAAIGIDVSGSRLTEIVGVTVSGGSIGGIVTYSPLVLGATTITGNTDTYGGGILAIASGYLAVFDSTISGNQASAASGIASIGVGDMVIENTTINGNRAAKSAGAIDIASIKSAPTTTAVIENSTIANNVSAGKIGGVYMNDPSSKLTILGSTITGNVAQNGGGGGVLDHRGQIAIEDTILARNHDSDTGSLASPDIEVDSTAAANRVRARFSLIGNGTQTGPGAVHTDRTDLVGSASRPINPHLAPLARIGKFSPNRTMVPKKGSPAIGHGNAEAFVSATSFPFIYDQRFQPRFGVGGSPKRSDGTDIGAVEVTHKAQVAGVLKGNQQFILSTSAKNKKLRPRQRLPVRYTSIKLTQGNPQLTFKSITMRVTGSRRTRRSRHSHGLIKFPLKGLAKGRHTLVAKVIFTFHNSGHTKHLKRTLRLHIRVA